MAEYARVLSQAHGSVLVAVGLVTTTAAVKGALPEVEPLADGPARAAAACAGVEAVGYGERCAVPLRFVGELCSEQRPGAVRDGAGESGFDEPRDTQLLDDQVAVGLGQSARLAMGEIVSGTGCGSC